MWRRYPVSAVVLLTAATWALTQMQIEALNLECGGLLPRPLAPGLANREWPHDRIREEP